MSTKDHDAKLLATEKNMTWWELPAWIKDKLREEASRTKEKHND